MQKFFNLSAGVLAIAAVAGCSTSNSKTAVQPGNTNAPVCKQATEAEIASLFDRWNTALQTGNPKAVVALYDEGSILLPTVSNIPRRTHAEIEDYFEHFMARHPVCTIDLRHVQIGYNQAVVSGLYTFTFEGSDEKIRVRYTYTYRWNGSEWKISSHHSSAMPEKPGAAAH